MFLFRFRLLSAGYLIHIWCSCRLVLIEVSSLESVSFHKASKMQEYKLWETWRDECVGSEMIRQMFNGFSRMSFL